MDALVSAGIPLNKLDNEKFRVLLEDGRRALTSRSHMSEFIPVLLQNLYNTIQNAVKGRVIKLPLQENIFP